MSKLFARFMGRGSNQSDMQSYVVGIHVKLAEPSEGSKGGLAAIVDAVNAKMSETVEAFQIGKHASGNPYVKDVDIRLVKFGSGDVRYFVQANITVDGTLRQFLNMPTKYDVERLDLKVLKSQENSLDRGSPYYTGYGGAEIRLLHIPDSQITNPAVMQEGMEQFAARLQHALGQFCYGGAFNAEVQRAGSVYPDKLMRNGRFETLTLGAQPARISGEYSQAQSLLQNLRKGND